MLELCGKTYYNRKTLFLQDILWSKPRSNSKSRAEQLSKTNGTSLWPLLRLANFSMFPILQGNPNGYAYRKDHIMESTLSSLFSGYTQHGMYGGSQVRRNLVWWQPKPWIFPVTVPAQPISICSLILQMWKPLIYTTTLETFLCWHKLIVKSVMI